MNTQISTPSGSNQDCEAQTGQPLIMRPVRADDGSYQKTSSNTAVGEGLRCPIPVRRHPEMDALHSSTRRWVWEFCEKPDGVLDQLRIGQFHGLAGRVAPDLSFDALESIHLWYVWLFLHDDVCDATVEGQSPDALERIHENLFEVLDGREPSPDDGLARWLQSLLVRYQARCPEPALEAFRSHVRSYLQANVWEAYYRRRQSIPPTSVYKELRADAGAALTAFELFPVVDARYRLPDQILKHPIFKAMPLLANQHISWVNDIFGLDRELGEKNPNNLVVSLAAAQGVELEDGLKLAATMCNDAMDCFMHIREVWNDLASEADRLSSRPYLDMLAGWMSGSLEWHCASPRYHQCLQIPVVAPRKRRGDTLPRNVEREAALSFQ